MQSTRKTTLRFCRNLRTGLGTRCSCCACFFLQLLAKVFPAKNNRSMHFFYPGIFRNLVSERNFRFYRNLENLNSPVVHHQLLNSDKGFVPYVGVFVPKKLHYSLLATKLFDDTLQKKREHKLAFAKFLERAAASVFRHLLSSENLLLATRIMTNIFADIEGCYTKNQRIFARLEQMNENTQQLVILFVQTTRVFAPKFARFVNGWPF